MYSLNIKNWWHKLDILFEFTSRNNLGASSLVWLFIISRAAFCIYQTFQLIGNEKNHHIIKRKNEKKEWHFQTLAESSSSWSKVFGSVSMEDFLSSLLLVDESGGIDGFWSILGPFTQLNQEWSV